MANAHSKVYSTKSNAKRAAKGAIENPVNDVAEEGVDYRIEQQDEKAFVWRRISRDTQHAPVHPNTPEPAFEDEAPVKPQSVGKIRDTIAAEEAANKEPKPEAPKKDYKKGAVKQVWDICEDNKDMKRKDVVQLCVDKGINYYTARTQYQAWYSASKNS